MISVSCFKAYSNYSRACFEQMELLGDEDDDDDDEGENDVESIRDSQISWTDVRCFLML